MGMLEQYIDVMCIAETQLNSSYPTSLLHLQGYQTP